MPGQGGWFGQAIGDARREQSKADAGSPSNWDVTTVERFVQGRGEYGAGGRVAGWRELLRSTGDERGLRLSHCGAVSFQSEKRGVQVARNGSSEDRKCWQPVELDIYSLKSWGRNWSRKVRETRSSSSQKRSERGREVLTARWVRYPFPEKLGPQLV